MISLADKKVRSGGIEDAFATGVNGCNTHSRLAASFSLSSWSPRPSISIRSRVEWWVINDGQNVNDRGGWTQGKQAD